MREQLREMCCVAPRVLAVDADLEAERDERVEKEIVRERRRLPRRRRDRRAVERLGEQAARETHPRTRARSRGAVSSPSTGSSGTTWSKIGADHPVDGAPGTRSGKRLFCVFPSGTSSSPGCRNAQRAIIVTVKRSTKIHSSGRERAVTSRARRTPRAGHQSAAGTPGLRADADHPIARAAQGRLYICALVVSRTCASAYPDDADVDEPKHAHPGAALHLHGVAAGDVDAALPLVVVVARQRRDVHAMLAIEVQRAAQPELAGHVPATDPASAPRLESPGGQVASSLSPLEVRPPDAEPQWRAKTSPSPKRSMLRNRALRVDV